MRCTPMGVGPRCAVSPHCRHLARGCSGKGVMCGGCGASREGASTAATRRRVWGECEMRVRGLDACKQGMRLGAYCLRLVLATRLAHTDQQHDEQHDANDRAGNRGDKHADRQPEDSISARCASRRHRRGLTGKQARGLIERPRCM